MQPSRETPAPRRKPELLLEPLRDREPDASAAYRRRERHLLGTWSAAAKRKKTRVEDVRGMNSERGEPQSVHQPLRIPLAVVMRPKLVELTLKFAVVGGSKIG